MNTSGRDPLLVSVVRVTVEHEIKTAPLNSIDRDLSIRLNQERRITFSLPVAGG